MLTTQVFEYACTINKWAIIKASSHPSIFYFLYVLFLGSVKSNAALLKCSFSQVLNTVHFNFLKELLLKCLFEHVFE